MSDSEGQRAQRASLGLATTFADAYAYVQFAAGFLDRPGDPAAVVGAPVCL